MQPLLQAKYLCADSTFQFWQVFAPPALSSFDEDRLVADLFNGYNSLIRPVPNATSPPIEVAFSLALVLLINIDEKNQIMHTNVWPTMKQSEFHRIRFGYLTSYYSTKQVCSLTFGSWTFKKEEVQISYHMGKRQVELNDYSFSGIWDVMEVPGLLIEDRSKISYQIRIRR
ncbi:Neurotransmitter-gated ion-channel ligand binding domain protein [Ancylostoma ceylanicum]|uniref:Neurotransmitter-gated ion-channel ligand binding domain protein n=1 Tax=Ancylostoma ceylanicum TaxID=53326 RepID=A0A0D6LWH8_9BILA|nr:Neurotransmitter-gated ion-channel ligand binding domain protein [Ancylostoma ceylanicum]